MQKEKISKEIIKSRYEIFNEAKKRIKNEFYGIDDVIEKVFKAIETFRAKIENAWNKYYADKVQNESVCNIDIDDLELD